MIDRKMKYSNYSWSINDQNVWTTIVAAPCSAVALTACQFRSSPPNPYTTSCDAAMVKRKTAAEDAAGSRSATIIIRPTRGICSLLPDNSCITGDFFAFFIIIIAINIHFVFTSKRTRSQ